MASEVDEKLHIVMFPWLAHGHINPYLQLAKLIALQGHFISFVSTPKNIDRLPKLPPNLASLIQFVKLPLPKVPNFPPDNPESTSDLPYHVIPFLKKAYDALEQPMTRFLESSNPDWLIHDFAPYWVGPIASKLGIKISYFTAFNAAMMSVFGPIEELIGTNRIRKGLEDMTAPPPWVPFPTTVAVPQYELAMLADSGSSENESGVSDGYRLGASLQNCDVLTIRSCYEFESEYLQVLQDIFRKPVLPVGELPVMIEPGVDENDETWRRIKEWLDKQRKGAVVYVAFGTEAKVREEQVREIAEGLEKSEVAFLWVLRSESELPEGFEERSSGRGLVWKHWAPQPKILGHECVGGFWTHGGWNSVVEGIQNGKPLLVLSFQLDQGVNARLLEEKKLGYSIPRDERDGSFTSEAVAKSLRLIMVEEEGRIYRENTKEMKQIFVNTQDGYVDKLLDYFKQYKNAKRVVVEEAS